MASDPARSPAIQMGVHDVCRTTTHGHECQRPATRTVTAPGVLRHRCCDYHARMWFENAYAGQVEIDPPLEEKAHASVPTQG